MNLPAPRSIAIKMSPYRERKTPRDGSAFDLESQETFRASTDAIVFDEILLAALLKLCNAAEEFLRAELKNLADDARFAR
jgi:hypothetical protein